MPDGKILSEEEKGGGAASKAPEPVILDTSLEPGSSRISIHKVPECLSLRRNWVGSHHPLPRERVCFPLNPKAAGATLHCG
jgi:hypothetical protein